jgi:hypothetical protein
MSPGRLAIPTISSTIRERRGSIFGYPVESGCPRYAPPVHMIGLTETQEIAPYPWVHPDDER